MKATETRLQPLIEGSKQYVVPLYQRPYTWEKAQWKILWGDLSEVIQDEDRTHFLGSIVTFPTQSVPEGVSKFLLIDGQQRLTTIFILLCAIRDRARRLGDKTIAGKIDELLLRNRFQEGTDEYKLLPTQADRGSFIALMDSQDGQPDSESKLGSAYAFFEKMIRNTSVAELELLRTGSISKLMIVSIVLERDDNPHLIFESLNAKGQPLSQGDLIRNYFFMKIHADKQDKLYKTHWFPMQHRLGDSLTECIRHFLMKDGRIVKERDVYFTLKSIGDEKVANDDVILYLAELNTFSEYYARLIDPRLEPDRGVAERLHRLNRLEVTTAYPFLLNIYHDYANGRLTLESLRSALDILENFIIRRLVCGVPTNSLNKIFPTLYQQAKEISAIEGTDIVGGIKTVLSVKSYPNDEDFREHFVSARLYSDRAERAKIILQRLEESYQHREVVDLNKVKVQVEHVMPQVMTEWWKSHMGEDWASVHEHLLHTIGNLTLTAYNQELARHPFPEKAQKLSQSHFELNKYFSTVNEWNESAIEGRGDALATTALQLWPYFGKAESSVPPNGGGVTGKKPVAIRIKGARYPVRNWREVAEKTIDAIAELGNEELERVMKAFPSIVGRDGSRFARPRSIKNGLFMESAVSAERVNRFCTQAAIEIGFSHEDWSVEIKK